MPSSARSIDLRCAAVLVKPHATLRAALDRRVVQAPCLRGDELSRQVFADIKSRAAAMQERCHHETLQTIEIIPQRSTARGYRMTMGNDGLKRLKMASRHAKNILRQFFPAYQESA